MPYLWEKHEEWEPVSLAGPHELAPGVRLHTGAGAASAAGAIWLLLASRDAAVRVNGEPLLIGVRVLRDKDEILVHANRLFFSTEKLARVETYRRVEGSPVFCGRCKKEVEHETPAVACPACGAWHHQSERLPCWTYAQTCALCSQTAHLGADAVFNWTPETAEVWS